jgi:hypothetical protein
MDNFIIVHFGNVNGQNIHILQVNVQTIILMMFWKNKQEN